MGIAKITTDPAIGRDQVSDIRAPIYNMRRPFDAPGMFAFNYLGAIVKIVPRLRPVDYGISSDTLAIVQAAPPFYVDVDALGRSGRSRP